MKRLGHIVLGAKATIALAVVSFVAFGATAFYTTNFVASGQMAAVVTSVLVNLLNTDRTANNLGELTVNPELVAAAQAKANDMAAKGYFAHTSPDGKNSWYWFQLEGYSFTYAGENLAVDFTDSDAVEQAWMNSPAHRANILNNHFTEVGIATAVGTYEGHTATFVVQMFGAPATATATASVGTIESVNTPTAPTDIAVAKTEVLGDSAKTIPAPVVQAAPTPPAQVSWYERLAASPQTFLKDIYLLIAAVILLGLISITGIELQKHHFRHVAAAAALLVLMAGLYAAADTLYFSHILII